MTSADVVTAATAIWGALTGSIALAIQWQQFRQDKVQLSIRPRMSVGQAATERIEDSLLLIDFEAIVVNTGRRVVRVEEVGISTRKDNNDSGLNIIVFGGRDQVPFSLEEGQKHSFQLRRWPDTLNNIAEHFSNEETAYVRLTSGRTFFAEFKTVKLSKVKADRASARAAKTNA